MERCVITNRQGYRIPHENMVLMRQSGILSLGVDNNLAAGLVNNSLGPKSTTASAAFHFWNWVGLFLFVGSVYWSFTKDWWWFIIGGIAYSAIWKSNKKGNAENFLDAAMTDKDFYDRVMAMGGWMYEISAADLKTLSLFKD